MADVDQLDWIKVNEPWRLEKKERDKKEPEIEPISEKLYGRVAIKSWDYMALTKIKGIGEERAKDIGRVYEKEEDLINALRENKVSLRNDIVQVLKEHFKINETQGGK